MYNHWNKQFINGQWREGNSNSVYRDVNPFNDEVLAEIRLANIEDIDEAYKAAEKAQKEWEAINVYERAAIMEKAVDLLEERKDEILQILVVENGASYTKAKIEINASIAIMKEAATFPLRMHGRLMPSVIPGKENRIYQKPAGVVGIISPFNFPFHLTMRSVAPALGAGNGVVLKPDVQTMISGGLFLGKLFEDAGIPKGLFNVTVCKSSEVGDSFVEHPIPSIISFTGSTPVGRHIGELCGKHLKRVALELGGNNAMVILKDADIERAASSAAFGKFLNSGQICMSLNRIIVERPIYEKFLEAFAEKASQVKYGDPRNEDVIVGPLINNKQVVRIQKLVEDSLAMGAKYALQGKVEGNVFGPTILSDVTNNMPIAQEEIFGPVVGVIAVESEEEAIQVANDSEYGLSGAVHAGSIEHGVKVAQQIVTGMIHVNDQGVNDEPIVAFGGEKASGLGRYGGEWALHEFTTTKWISVQTEPREYPF
ncbi:aldehyde dehydrogenase [Ureibacillus massiliensis 4400831 = CIP 108448 = CCUG 49529]|uniref:3-sulfolactaldehyde dehydrogenase n=1 Tax=Ureibacillus massiliensis 4400831 = CIP 108448 = CCUG 49529 TaxID=1211035 RepID=A0A0A3J3A5_9BACL|nr:aldehyde dehydrogenase family protein [Ureibacillus massiliensis]KGR89658.1 aldehyde dehydrogenase [Ureibacillus massiliensis 4400831 = CIP 108448 = CCUG 49529]